MKADHGLTNDSWNMRSMASLRLTISPVWRRGTIEDMTHLRT
jgi:hypothetical protein